MLCEVVDGVVEWLESEMKELAVVAGVVEETGTVEEETSDLAVCLSRFFLSFSVVSFFFAKGLRRSSVEWLKSRGWVDAGGPATSSVESLLRGSWKEV